jgi:hypothetical protein
MWNTLQTHNEGTNHVKETRIDMCVRKFELFEIEEDGYVDQMYGRFTIIIMNPTLKTYTAHEKSEKNTKMSTKELKTYSNNYR